MSRRQSSDKDILDKLFTIRTNAKKSGAFKVAAKMDIRIKEFKSKKKRINGNR